MLISRHQPTRYVFVFLVAVLVGCAGQEGPGATEQAVAALDAALPVVSFRNITNPTRFTGDAACASCHEEAYAGYQSHGMANAYYALTDSNRVEQLPTGPLTHESTGFTYTVIAEPDGWYQEERIVTPNGRTVHRLLRRMDYVVGSGNAARTYLTESNGRLYELPLTWYTRKQQWNFSPGYEQVNGRFGRLVPNRCMACHNGLPEAVPFVEGKYTSVPEGITCERCHGPGDLHVEARLAAPEPAGDVDDTIVNPARLPFSRRLDVCRQCHLSTSLSVLREGRGPYDFRPSEALDDHVALFTAGEGFAESGIDVISHADRMQQSACFAGTLAAGKPFECTTCHNPHEGFRDKGPDYFNNTCIGCHAAASLQAALAGTPSLNDHGATADCFSCHMPRVQADDAPHASFTDHWIRVVKETPAAAPLNTRPNQLPVPYFDRDKDTRGGEIYRAMAMVVSGRQANDPAAMAQGAARLEKALGADTTRGEAHFILGVGYQQIGNLERALPSLERAVRIDPENPERLEVLAQAYEAAGRGAEVIDRLYTQALRLQPALASARLHYAQFLQREGRVEEAAEAYRAALDEQPELDAAAFSLGLVLTELRAYGEARLMFSEALSLDPVYGEVLGHMLVVRAASFPAQGSGRSSIEAVVEVIPYRPLVHPLVLNTPPPDAIRIKPVTRQDLPVDAQLRAREVVRLSGLPDLALVGIYSASGVVMRTLEKKTATERRWDLKDAKGRLLPSGMYLMHVRAVDGEGRSLWTRVLRFALVKTRAQVPSS